MLIKQIECKSILNKSKLLDYCINPYTGCQHGCAYCYARFMKKYTNHDEEWGDFVDVKANAVDILKKELKKKRSGSVFISSVTDAYQPIEAKYKLTRSILEALPKDFSIYIQTKSILVLRDIDIISKFKDAEIGFTITFYDDNDRKNFEPVSSPINERIKALKEFSNAGIKTTAFLGPMLPFISDKNLNELFEKISFVDNIWLDKLNIKSGNWQFVIKVIKEKYPELLEKYNEIFFGKDAFGALANESHERSEYTFGALANESMERSDNNYYNKLKQKIKQIKNEVRFCY